MQIFLKKCIFFKTYRNQILRFLKMFSWFLIKIRERDYLPTFILKSDLHFSSIFFCIAKFKIGRTNQEQMTVDSANLTIHSNWCLFSKKVHLRIRIYILHFTMHLLSQSRAQQWLDLKKKTAIFSLRAKIIVFLRAASKRGFYSLRKKHCSEA